LDRRLPKFGFRSAMAVTRAEVRLHELDKVEGGVVDLESLKKAGVIPVFAERAKVVLSGEIKKAVTLKGIGATKGARAAIEAAGGTIEEPQVKAEDVPKARDPVKRAAAEAKIKAKAEADEKARVDAKAAKEDAKAGKASAKAAKAAKDESEPKKGKAEPKGEA
jgi:hypothetical protein